MPIMIFSPVSNFGDQSLSFFLNMQSQQRCFHCIASKPANSFLKEPVFELDWRVDLFYTLLFYQIEPLKNGPFQELIQVNKSG